MSADLFEAFVGTQSSEKDSRESISKSSPGLLVDHDNLPTSEDTWQSWPAAAEIATEPLSKRQPQPLWESDGWGKHVLFDASHALSNSDDEFGDFEQVVKKEPDNHVQHLESQLAEANLLDLDSDEIAPTEAVEPKDRLNMVASHPKQFPVLSSSPQLNPGGQIRTSSNALDDDWGDFETTQGHSETATHLTQRNTSWQAMASTSPKKSVPARAKPSEKVASTSFNPQSNLVENKHLEEELWDDFDDGEPQKVNRSSQSGGSPPQQNPVVSVVAIGKVQQDRPTNIPPPAVLLAWLPGIFSGLTTEARQSNTDQTAGTAALQAYRVTARIIAGRASRWKRDTILAQSMRIGIAGRSGGMKLTALDKGESRREDQAAEEAIASWGRVSHVLNAAMIRAKAQKPPMALSSKLSARPATGLDVVSATHICAICGLRRNERVIGIDVSVSDTFGEFWIEHWGHKDCADTWYRFNQLLEQR